MSDIERALKTIDRWSRHLDKLEPETVGDAVDIDMLQDDLEHLRGVVQAARQAPASGEVEPVMELDISEDRCFSPILIDATLSLPAGHYELYTHPPAKVPEERWRPSELGYDHSIHTNPDAKAWADLFMATFPNCGADPETMHGWFANAMMAMYDHMRSATPTPATIPETEWVKCADRLPTEADADCDDCAWVCWTEYGKWRVDREDCVDIDCDYFAWMPTGLKRPTPPQEQ